MLGPCRAAGASAPEPCGRWPCWEMAARAKAEGTGPSLLLCQLVVLFPHVHCGNFVKC